MRWRSKWVKFRERNRKLKLKEETEFHNNIEKSVIDRYIPTCKLKYDQTGGIKRSDIFN